MPREVDAETGEPLLSSFSPESPSPTTTSSRIWLLRRWRSMPRLFQVYLIAALIMLLVILGVVSLSSSITYSINSSRQLSNNQHQQLQDTAAVVDQPPSGELQPNNNEDQQIDDIFKFKSSDSLKEISYSKDLLHSRHNSDQQQVIEAMKYSWDAYKAHAWGSDHLTPMNQGKQNWFHVGLTIIDSLDTLLLMGEPMKYAADDAIDWIENTLSFDIYKDVNCFEMSIRVLGGLLSGFHVTKKPGLLQKAVDVGDRLIHCFDSPSKKVPFSDVNLRTKEPRSPSWSQESSLSEVSSMQLEFRDLSRVTKETRFEDKSFATSIHLHKLVHDRNDPLLPMYVNPNTGALTSSTVTLGARGDSYYEYLFKQFLQTTPQSSENQWLREDYLDAVDAIQSRLVKETNGPKKFKYPGELLRGGDLNPKMDHLVCFLPGLLALGHYHHERSTNRQDNYRGHEIVIPAEDKNSHDDKPDASSLRFSGHLVFAEELARTCFNMYNMTATGLSPEIVYFGTSESEDEMYIKPADAHNLLRPEYIESLFYLFHLTGKEMYRDQGRKILSSFNKYTRVPSGGYTSIDDVRNPDRVRPRNMQESFWTAETLKYLFLLFSDDKLLVNKILNHYVFNTEAHLIPLRV